MGYAIKILLDIFSLDIIQNVDITSVGQLDNSFTVHILLHILFCPCINDDLNLNMIFLSFKCFYAISDYHH